MPYYKITFILASNSQHMRDQPVLVYRQYKEQDIEKVWQLIENKCRLKWGNRLKFFDCIIFSKRSPDYQVYVKQLGTRLPSLRKV